MVLAYDPRFSSFEQWAARLAQTLAPYGFVARIPKADDWQSFARAVVAVPAMAATIPVQPTLFSDWRSWAFKVNESVLLLGSQ